MRLRDRVAALGCLAIILAVIVLLVTGILHPFSIMSQLPWM